VFLRENVMAENEYVRMLSGYEEQLAELRRYL
jgi:hypothetical protein